ncbi:MAG: GTP pyrophosphokinase family protein [Lachnospiraceae bacterium]|nr:GTP pyrophosphokinase family protein [Lachnospiraceae bacterium]
MIMSDFYGESLFVLQSALDEMLAKIELVRKYRQIRGMRDPVEHYKGRIKTEESMIEKLKRRGMEVTVENALTRVHDAVGVRIVCRFVDDVYEIADMMSMFSDLEIIERKDYIASPKTNGYRSLHMVALLSVTLPGETRQVPVEIQIRTLAQDTWAALEHQLKYKKDVEGVALIQKELKRCADEIASTDLSLQTVRDMMGQSDIKD